MRILQVDTTDRGGGAEEVALGLHRALRRRGHEASLAVGRRRTDEPGVVELPAGGRLRARHDALRARGRHRVALAVRVAGSPGVAADLVRGREDFCHPGSHEVLRFARDADVVHLHNLHGWYFDLRLLPELTAAARTVLTLHDEWTLTGHCAFTLGCERWRDGCGGCPHLSVYPRLLRDGTAWNLARKRALYARSSLHVVAPVGVLLERATASALAPAIRSARTIANGIDVDAFAPAADREEVRRRLGFSTGTRVVVCASQGGEANVFKDPATLRAAFGALGAVEGPPVVVLAFGSSGESARLGRVELRRPGVVLRDVLADHLRAADVFVHATRADAQPLAVLEALASGTPVVASRVGGLAETVSDGETGVLVHPGEAAALARGIARVLDDGDLARRLGAAGRADAERRFSLDREVAEYVGLYAALVEGGRPPG